MGKSKISGGSTGKFIISNGTVTQRYIDHKIKQAAFVVPSPIEPTVESARTDYGHVSLGGNTPQIGILKHDEVAVVNDSNYAIGKVSVVFPDNTIITSAEIICNIIDVYGVFPIDDTKFCAFGFVYNEYLVWNMYEYNLESQTIVRYANGTIKDTTYKGYSVPGLTKIKDGKYRSYSASGNTLKWLEFDVVDNQLNVTKGQATISGIYISTETYFSYTIQYTDDEDKLLIKSTYDKSTSSSSTFFLADLNSKTGDNNAGSYRNTHGSYSSAHYEDGYLYYVFVDTNNATYTLNVRKKVNDSWTNDKTVSFKLGSAVDSNYGITKKGSTVIIWMYGYLILIDIDTCTVLYIFSYAIANYTVSSCIAMGTQFIATGYIYSASNYYGHTFSYLGNIDGVYRVTEGRGDPEFIMPANSGNKLIDCFY